MLGFFHYFSILFLSYEFALAGNITIPTYWINIDSMKYRKLSMEAHLSSLNFTYHRRIPALTPKTCNLIMVDSSCNRVGLVDIAILCSHVSTLHYAVYDDDPKAVHSDYFLILEDDIRFKFDIDFSALIGNAPAGFSSIQLMISHKTYIENHWTWYENSKELFTYRPRNSTVWSAQAVLYRKSFVKSFVDKAVIRDRKGNLGYKLVNSFDYSKLSPDSVNQFKPAVASECLFADMFMYAMAQPCYIFNIPLLNSATAGANSSFHQAHVAYHVQGYAKIQQIHSEISEGKASLPDFIKQLPPTATAAADGTNWQEIAAKNPVSGRGIPKRFNNEG